VVKTNVYLDDGLKADLARAAARAGTSQSQLIRDGVRQIVDHYLWERPAMTAYDDGDPITDRIDELMAGFGR
jgi:predicted transcriptional regulator